MDEASDLWIDVDIETEQIPQPASTREQVLPLQSLSWENFERLCYRLAVRGSDAADCRRYGTSGQKQEGIDLLVRRVSDGRYATWQCKRHREFTVGDLRTAVDKFLAGDWAVRSALFHLAMSISLVPTKFAEAVEAAARKCQADGIEFVPLDAERLSEMLKPHADLVDDFFGRYWAEAFCGPEAVKHLSGRKLSKPDRLKARRRLRELYETHFATIDVGLPAAAPRFRRAAPPLALHDRFVIPVVEALTSVLEVVNGHNSPVIPDTASSHGQANEPVAADGPSRRGALKLQVREQHTQSDLFTWLASADRAVLLGGPGLGKSASLRFVALDVLLERPRSLELVKRWGAYLPLFLPFAFLTRMIAANEAVSIPDCCRAWFRSLSARAEEAALLEEALEDERLLLLLDGLDEWSDATAAHAVLAKVQAFIDSRHLPAIASARPLGYERLGGFGPAWKHAELMPFAQEQQRQFALRWFEHFITEASSKSDGIYRAGAAERETDALLQELDEEPALGELAGVPLLLSAMIYLRLEGRALPQNRFEVLEAIANTLIAEQPLRRAKAALQGSGASRNARMIVERGIEILALAVHQQAGSDAVTEDNARDVLTEFFEGEAFKKSPNDAREIASDLIEQATQTVGILVERHPGHIGFLHRSLQEHLAAKRLVRLSFSDLKVFVAEKVGDATWQEVLLQILNRLERVHEVDELFRLTRDTRLQPLAEPIRQILLARAVGANLNCSPSLAKEIADSLFAVIEVSPWMPLRVSLLSALARGIDCEHIGAHIRQRLERWFPSGARWRYGLFNSLASKPVAGTDRRLMIALFNSDSDAERKEIAEAIAGGVSNWPDLVDELRSAAMHAAEPELAVAILHAIALGWPSDSILPELLRQGSECSNDDVRCVALLHRARRGDTSPSVKEGLAEFCSYNSHPYPWEKDLIEVLAQQWPGDFELRTLALSAAPHPVMAPKLNPRIALRYLVKSYPGDNDVAEIIAGILRREKYISVAFERSEGWEDIQAGFAGHPTVVPAVEEWLERHGKTRHNEMDIAHAAMLGGSAKCKAFLIERLAEGGVLPIWPISALIQIAGAADAEVLAAAAPYIADEEQGGRLGSILPDLIPDRGICQIRLLQLLQTATGFEISHVLRGLARINALTERDTLDVLERRLEADANRHFWWGAKDSLIQHLPHHPVVRRAAMLELNEEDASLSALATAYADDSDFRPYLEALLEPLHEQLRLEIVRAVRNFALRSDDAFARTLLGKYRREWHAPTRTAAAEIYYSAVRKLGEDVQPEIDSLKKELTSSGSGYSERCQSAAVGLLALGHPEAICEARLDGQSQLPQISLSADVDVNWEMLRILVRDWETVLHTYADRAWTLFGSWDVIVAELARSGKRALAFLVPKSVEGSIHMHIDQDVDGFRALTVLQPGTDSLRDLCLGFFSRFKGGSHTPSISWGYRQLEVIMEAAHYLAQHHGGDPDLGRQLEEIAETAVETTGPVIALCLGWPQSRLIQTIWDSRGTAPFNAQPATAWLVSAKASPEEFKDYMLSLPRALRATWFRFPAETLKAVRHRLSRDADAQRLLLQHLLTSNDIEQQATAARLLGISSQQHEALRQWAAPKIEQLRNHPSIPLMPYDILRGRHRPLELCLLDTCLAK